jgi:hypothetical protein
VIDATAALALGLLTAGLIVALIASVRLAGPTRARLLALVASLVLAVGFSVRHWQTLYLHYFFVMLPITALVMVVPAAGLRFGPPAAVRLVRRVGLTVGAAIVVLQGLATVGGMAYQGAAAGTDPCFMTSLGVMRALAADTADFGRAAGSTRAVVELDAATAKPMAYLLRPDFPAVYLPRTRLLSQTPTLVGDVGLDTAPATSRAAHEPVLLTASAPFDAHFVNGVGLHDVIYTAQSAVDQHLALAITWSVDPAASAAEPVVWQVSLIDPAGQPFGSDAGESWVPADLRGQQTVSWFWFDPRRAVAPADVPPGAYRLALRLLDTSVDPAPAVPLAPAGSPGTTVSVPVKITPNQHCDLLSAIP